MGFLSDLFSSENKEKDTLNDASYIRSVRHIEGPWHQYDFTFAARGYGWDYILSSAKYMTEADLENVGTISVSPAIGSDDIECISEYRENGCSLEGIKALQNEGSMLGLGGMSRTCRVPVKIVWINQTNVIRALTPCDDIDLMIRYMETVIRRSFGSADAMKKGNSEIEIAE